MFFNYVWTNSWKCEKRRKVSVEKSRIETGSVWEVSCFHSSEKYIAMKIFLKPCLRPRFRESQRSGTQAKMLGFRIVDSSPILPPKQDQTRVACLRRKSDHPTRRTVSNRTRYGSIPSKTTSETKYYSRFPSGVLL